MARIPDVPCALCGELMWSGTTSLPPGEAVCRPCRKVLPKREPQAPTPRKQCVDCGAMCWATRCRPCYDLHIKADPKTALRRKRERAIRQRRECAAPGLTRDQRRKLGLKWRRQGRRCTYCDALATQVDHVMPLALGGTNYEGNLTPCCASCNVHKSDSLLIEWKWKIRVKRERVEPPPLPIKAKVKRVRVGRQLSLFKLGDLGYTRAKPKVARQCAKCGTVFHTHTATYCSKRCQPSTMSGAQRRKRRREDPGGTIAA